MSHYNIDYTNLPELEKRKQAYTDIIEYLGAERVERLEAVFTENPNMTENLFYFAASFAGVQGYPARVWYERLFPTVS